MAEANRGAGDGPALSGFDIDGKVYPVPTLDTFDMDEAQILYDNSGLSLEDFVYLNVDPSDDEIDDRVQKMKNPAVVRSLIQVAYMRLNPDATRADVAKRIGKVNWLKAAADMIRASQEDDALPPELTTEPDESSPSGSVTSPLSSSDASTNGSDEPVSDPANTGRTRSGTSSPASPRIELVG